METAYRELTKFIHGLWEFSTKAELSAIHHLNTCQVSHANCVQAAKESASAKDKLVTAAKCLREAEKVQEANWIAMAILELIATKTVSTENRLRLPPSVLEWVDAQDEETR